MATFRWNTSGFARIFFTVRERKHPGRNSASGPLCPTVLLSLLMILLGMLPEAHGSDDPAAPVAEARRTAAAPAIDGRLDESEWGSAPAVSEFRQKDPVEGDPATEVTRVRILYDEAFLYIGVKLLDGQPSLIRASELRRDNELASDDSFTIVLDSYHDHRNAFLFRVNPRGTRYDALVRNESFRIFSEWDEDWTVAATMGETGWTAEIAIPFKILRFSGAQDQIWGVNFERVIKRKNESVYWTSWNRDFDFFQVSQAGHLRGLSEIRPGERLRIRPYLLGGYESLGTLDPPRSRRQWEAGLDDVKISLTSNLTADLTLNPDFAQTEVDDLQVNLTRFSLFFREKRQFFIEGSDMFRMRIRFLHFGPPPLEPFYSRRIGLSEDREPIPVLGGGKLTGKVAGFDLGLLNMQTGQHKDQPGENFTVARVRKEIFGRSYIGGIFTNRQGGAEWNRVAGADANFVLFNHLTVGGMLAKSSTRGVQSQQSVWNTGFEWRSDFFDAGGNYLKIAPNFNPGVGFVRRRDRLAGARVSFKPRPGGNLVRQFRITPGLVFFHDDAGLLQSRSGRFQTSAIFQSGDVLALNFENLAERISEPFPIHPTVTLPPGLYEWNEAEVVFDSYNGRKVSGTAAFTLGSFYNGTKRSVSLAGDYRPNQNLSVEPSYEFNDVDLDQGPFRTHLVGMRTNVSFTTNLLVAAFVQFNSADELAAIQLRLNYIFRSIDNFYVVYNETRLTEGPFAGRTDRSLILKITYSLHY